MDRFVFVKDYFDMAVNRFGEKLKTLRLSQTMTLQSLAESLGYKSHGYLSELEAGKKMPTVELVVDIATLFNVTTDELLLDDIELKSVKRKAR
jgi:transcriptional regulator with XRE-family HTH domain